MTTVYYAALSSTEWNTFRAGGMDTVIFSPSLEAALSEFEKSKARALGFRLSEGGEPRSQSFRSKRKRGLDVLDGDRIFYAIEMKFEPGVFQTMERGSKLTMIGDGSMFELNIHRKGIVELDKWPGVDFAVFQTNVVVDVQPQTSHTWNFFKMSDNGEHKKLIDILTKNMVGSKLVVETGSECFFRDAVTLCLLHWVTARGDVDEFRVTQLQSDSWKAGWAHLDRAASPLCPFSFWSRSDELVWSSSVELRAKVRVKKTPPEPFSTMTKGDVFNFYKGALASVEHRLLDAEALVLDLQDEKASVMKKLRELDDKSAVPSADNDKSAVQSAENPAVQAA